MRAGRSLLVVLLGAALLGQGRPAEARETAAEIVAVDGTVRVVRGGVIERGAEGVAVAPADEIFCGVDGRARLRFRDGSIVSIGANSRVRVAEFATDAAGRRLSAVLSMVRGVIRAIVGAGGAAARFEVETSTAIASVRSTDWFVDSLEGRSAVFVREGEVAVVPKEVHAEILLRDGEGIDIVAGGRPPGEPARWSARRIEAIVERTALP